MSENKNQSKKIFAALVFLFVVLGVVYFIYSAIRTSSNPGLGSVQTQNQRIDEMSSEGLQDFQAPTVAGEAFKLSQVTNKVVVLNFWASWCGPCVEEFPSMLEMMDQTNGQVALVLISLDTDEEQMKAFLQNYNLTNPNIYQLKDPGYTLAESFGTFKLPESYILDRERKLLKKVSGSIDWTATDVLGFLNVHIQ